MEKKHKRKNIKNLKIKRLNQAISLPNFKLNNKYTPALPVLQSTQRTAGRAFNKGYNMKLTIEELKFLETALECARTNYIDYTDDKIKNDDDKKQYHDMLDKYNDMGDKLRAERYEQERNQPTKKYVIK